MDHASVSRSALLFADTPIIGVKHLEVPLGAIASDVIYAQVVGLIYSIAPLITCQAVDPALVDAVKDLQRFTNWGADKNFNLRQASDHAFLDNIQLGTGIYYIPNIERTHKGKVWSSKFYGPLIRAIST